MLETQRHTRGFIAHGRNDVLEIPALDPNDHDRYATGLSADGRVVVGASGWGADPLSYPPIRRELHEVHRPQYA